VLSILLPVYNRDIRDSLRALHRQAVWTGVPFEILCIEDGSEEAYVSLNREIASLEGVCYEVLPNNTGRSAVRNRLAASSRYDYLLFMDADFQLIREDYLAAYLSARSPDTVLVGGSCYPTRRPEEPSLFLRWHYGVAREQISPGRRQKLGWKAFTSHHFFLHRKAFELVRFDETLRTYGHEDTLFGTALAAAGFQIRHLDNPLMHLEIDPAGVYLDKVADSVVNLYRLKSQGKQIPSGLWKAFQLLHTLRLDGAAATIFPMFAPAIKRQLSGGHALLFLLDLYRLFLLCCLAKSGPGGIAR
jgi:glycosyltransferase involved in cell wall biosynthesis